MAIGSWGTPGCGHGERPRLRRAIIGGIAMKCLALDIGSSSMKGAVLDLATGGIPALTARAFPARLTTLPAGRFEVDPREIENAAREVLAVLASAAPDAERLFVAGQMGGMLLVDVNGEPLTNYLSWRDQRTESADSGEESLLRRLRGGWTDETFDSLGRELQAGSTLALLHWLAVRGELPLGATPLTVADYVISRLCGTSGHMHVTHAIGLLDLRATDWHREVFESLGLNELRWPTLVHSMEPVGECRIGNRALTVFGAFGDQQCALFGAGLERGELSINVSTGSQVSRRAERLQPGEFQTRAYFHGDLLQTITHLPAGRALNVLVDLLTELSREEGARLSDPWRAIARLTEQASRTSSQDGLAVDLSFFATPFGSTGGIAGITTENLTVGHLFRAAFDSMADNYARCAMRLDSTRSWNQVVLSGSLARGMPSLRGAISERFDAPLRDAVCDEETLLGLLRIASEVETGPKSSNCEACSGVPDAH